MDKYHKTNPDYGIDAPRVIRNLLISGAIILVVSLFLFSFSNVLLKVLVVISIITSLILLTESILMIIYSKVGKFHYRDRMLNMISWKGNEKALDIGTGRGLLMIGVAKKLTKGKSIGIDIWKQSDLTDNTYNNAVKNAELEGVKDKVELKNMDVQKMSFPDSFFDVIISNLCIHNISDKNGRDKACQEIVRVLKPGGIVLISDFKNTKQYAVEFQKAGLHTSLSKVFYFDTFPPLRIVKGMKTQ